MTYLVSQILPLMLAAAFVGILLGWYVTRWVNQRQLAFGPRADELAPSEADEALAERDQQLTDLRTELDRRVNELTAARRQLADIKEGMRDTVGLEAELITAREMAEKVPPLQAQVAQLTAELASRSLDDDVVIDLRDGSDPAIASEPVASEPVTSEPVTSEPVTSEPVWQGDDLTELEGVTPEAATALRSRGIRSFAQLANLAPSELAGLDASLGEFAGQATRGGWVGKAAERIARQRFGVTS